MKKSVKDITFYVPPISSDTKKIICVRPGRDTGPNISHEQKGSKHVFHNYGAGGSGWTLSFACVGESIKQFKAHLASTKDAGNNIAIIGAGVMGLLTAIELKKLGVEIITLIDRDPNGKKNASYNAGGLFAPSALYDTPEQKSKIDDMILSSYRQFLDILLGKHEILKEGVALKPWIINRNRDTKLQPIINAGLLPPPLEINAKSQLPGARRMPLSLQYTLSLDTSNLMEQLRTYALRLPGVTIQASEVRSFEDVCSPCIFNCAGVGGGILNHDPNAQPKVGLVFLQSSSTSSKEPELCIDSLQQDIERVRRIADTMLLPKDRYMFNSFCIILDKIQNGTTKLKVFVNNQEKHTFFNTLFVLMHEARTKPEESTILTRFYANLIPDTFIGEQAMYSVTLPNSPSSEIIYFINGRIGGTFMDPPKPENEAAFYQMHFDVIEKRHKAIALGVDLAPIQSRL